MKTPIAAIAGLGMTEMSRKYSMSAKQLAVEATRLAMADAGLTKQDVDGLLINVGVIGMFQGLAEQNISIDLQRTMGFKNLRLLNNPEAYGSTAGQIVQFASMAVQAGLANNVVCVFTDTPLLGDQAGGSVFGQPRAAKGFDGLSSAYGIFGANALYALAARRHMALYGTTTDHLGAIAISNRQWASLNPRAILKEPITMEDYYNSRWIVEPFHLFDCALPTNGAVALIVTSVQRARDMKQPPVYVQGMGQGHPGNPQRAGYENEVNTGAQIARETAFQMAGITARDIDICEFYDCYTYVTLVTLEDYGFCAKGEGGDFVSDGKLAPGGSLPTNTSGGHSAAYYMHGMTPISEAVIQARGQGGARQAPKHDVVLATSQGGILDYHACLILSPHSSLS